VVLARHPRKAPPDPPTQIVVKFAEGRLRGRRQSPHHQPRSTGQHGHDVPRGMSQATLHVVTCHSPTDLARHDETDPRGDLRAGNGQASRCDGIVRGSAAHLWMTTRTFTGDAFARVSHGIPTGFGKQEVQHQV